MRGLETTRKGRSPTECLRGFTCLNLLPIPLELFTIDMDMHVPQNRRLVQIDRGGKNCMRGDNHDRPPDIAVELAVNGVKYADGEGGDDEGDEDCRRCVLPHKGVVVALPAHLKVD